MSEAKSRAWLHIGALSVSGEGGAKSIPGELIQRNLLRKLPAAGMPEPELLVYEPVSSFPRCRRLFCFGRAIDSPLACRARTLGHFNLGAIKIGTLGLAAAWRTAHWAWKHRKAPRRLLTMYNLTAPPAALVWPVCRLFRIDFVPYIGDIYVPGETVPNSWLRRLEFRIQTALLRRADGLIVCNEDIVTDFAPKVRWTLLDGGVSDPEILAPRPGCAVVEGGGPGVSQTQPLATFLDPSGVEAFRSEVAAGAYGEGEATFQMVFAAELGDLDGVQLLLDAMRELSDHPNLRLHIFGKGKYESEVVEAAKWDGRIRFHGFVDYEVLQDANRRADLLLVLRRTTMRTERYFFPFKLVECLATGTPVLTTATGHAARAFGTCAFALHDETPSGLAAEIRRIAGLPRSARSELARRACREMADSRAWANQAKRLRRFLEDVEMPESSTALLPSRVLVFVDYFVPGYKGGGPVQSVSRLIQILKDEFDFAVFTRDRDLGEAEPYPGLPIGQWTEQNGVRHFYASPSQLNARVVLKAIRETRPDVIYLNSYFSKLSRIVLRLRLLGKLKGIAILTAPRGEFSEGALALKALKKRAYLGVARAAGLHRKLTWQVSSTKELADTRAVIAGDPRCFIKAPDILLPIGRMPRFDLEKRTGECRFAFVGRISPMKNLVCALEMLASIEGDVYFEVYGPAEDAAYMAECRAAMRELPPNIRVDLRGPIPPDQVFEALSKAHFLLLPTLGENFGHVIPEALAAGCPVLISDRTPWVDLETHGAGWAMPLEDRGLWHKTLQDCVDMDAKTFAALSRSAFAYVAKRAEASSDRETNRAMFAAALANQGRRAA